MKGKILRVFNNDLYGKVDDREVIIFAAFIHKKYMNKYAIFIFKNGEEKNKLCYGSIHVKETSLVIFKIREELKSVIDDFLLQYTSGQLLDYELIDINNLTKVELIGHNQCDYDKILLLEDLSLPKVTVNNQETQKKLSLGIKILIGLGVLIGIFCAYLAIHPNILKSKQLICYKDSYHQETKLNYRENLRIIFDGEDNLWQYNVEEVYYFKSKTSFDNFRSEGKHYIYFHGEGKSYNFLDNNLSLQITYKVQSDINNYDDMKIYLNSAGYRCTEDVYDE